MATTFKPFGRNDIISSKTLLHENIPLTGTILSGTYSENNIKNYSHGMFQSVYDYPYLSSSANHIFDITVGFSNDSEMSGTTAGHTQVTKKINLYNQMAQMLVGYDTTGSILKFDADGDLLGGGAKIKEAVFISFSRLLVKDEIKKGSFTLTLGAHKARTTAFNQTVLVKDASGESSYKVNSPAGEYGILYATASVGGAAGAAIIDVAVGTTTAVGSRTYKPCGLIYYQAGIAVLTASLFMDDGNNSGGQRGIIDETNSSSSLGGGGLAWNLGSKNIEHALSSSAISASAEALRTRIQNVTMNNTTELNSTIYFCRIAHNEYNYSANPTYLSASQIRVKSNSTDVPVSYITTVGLYSQDGQLLAVGKLSEPLRKDPTIEYTLRARLDY